MSRYAQAKAELARALVVPEQPRLLPGPDPDRYAVITVMQPWAWLIAHAPTWPEHVQGKTIENRGSPTNYRGPVLIHVSRRWERIGEQLTELRRLGLVGRGCPEPNAQVMRSQLGQVIAVAELVGCRRIGSVDPHPWAIAGAWGWELEGIELVQPFGLRGAPGLWFAPRGVQIRRRPRTLELVGLPIPANAGELRLRADASTGRASIDVSGFAEAVDIVLRAGVRRLDYMIRVNGASMRCGELLARAAAELGDEDASRRILEHLRLDLVGDVAPTLADPGPRLHGCARGPRG